ncbi:helix-turn-helix transcriptional regulator [Cupriavidus basilensis]
MPSAPAPHRRGSASHGERPSGAGWPGPDQEGTEGAPPAGRRDGEQGNGGPAFVSETTVKTHLRSINAKLGASSRTHAVAVARKLGLIA